MSLELELLGAWSLLMPRIGSSGGSLSIGAGHTGYGEAFAYKHFISHEITKKRQYQAVNSKA